MLRRKIFVILVCVGAVSTAGSLFSQVKDPIDVIEECKLETVDPTTDPVERADIDCNHNLIRDKCEIRLGLLKDENQDGIPDECKFDENEPVRVFSKSRESARQLEALGFVPRETLDFIEANKEALAADPQAIVDALAVRDFKLGKPEDIPALAEQAGGGASGGVLRGSFFFAISSQGLFVGAFYSQAVWDDSADPCNRAITGHTHVGGVINAVCNSFQVGNVFTNSCPATSSCPAPTAECIALQVKCQQIFGPTLNNFNSPAEILCAPCEEATQRPGDCNADGRVDVGDPICLLGHIFLGSPSVLTCGDGTARDPSNITILDWNGDHRIDIADPISSLKWLFGANGAPGAPHILGTQCIVVTGCPDDCI